MTKDAIITVPQPVAGETPRLPPRERIMLAARDLFYRLGLNSVGVEAIADAADTNKMTLYRHFRSKDDLIVAYVQSLASEGDAAYDAIFHASTGSPEHQIARWITHIETILASSNERGCALANAAVELHAAHPARALIEAYKQRKRNRLVTVFTAAGYSEPDMLADEVFLLFEGARISIQCGERGPASRLISMLRSLLAAAPRVS